MACWEGALPPGSWFFGLAVVFLEVTWETSVCDGMVLVAGSYLGLGCQRRQPL